ncbi:MAG: bifunctional phosphoribosylaminoimidazolecarboxamide formyltransferase/IMP cyclohydrolase [Candidatus Omnitrophica bacterium]|nr:bifunctional phosphoribosylaminoimidazolecarboxamide formyltransferase/IMP cyclohydrolase [Candidatus Omnitrophota bacterium]
MKVKRALVSVSDKTGLDEFVKGIDSLGVEIISTGGTAKFIRSLGVEVKDVSEFTGFPEIMDGRVKTLHPKIHGALLALRDNREHMDQARKHDIGLIDMVVVNLYPFSDVISKQGVAFEEAIENIDIGGPSMLRSAAKNFRDVAVICDPGFYASILEGLNNDKCSLSEETLLGLAVNVFNKTSEYDRAITGYLEKKRAMTNASPEIIFPSEKNINLAKVQDLRYGENPHQKAAFYRDRTAGDPVSLPYAEQLHGKELSFNNLLDLNAALETVIEFEDPAVCIIKHSTPCGVAVSEDVKEAFLGALDCDRMSAFGGIIGSNRQIDESTAREITKAGFIECIIAPGYDKKAIEALTKKKNLRILKLDIKKAPDSNGGPDIKRIMGGALLQERDTTDVKQEDLRVVTKKQPSSDEIDSLYFAWKTVKHVKSNAIVLCKDKKTVGIGAGQMSRIDSVLIAIRKAKDKAVGSVLASDAFFPKSDSIEAARKAGVKAIIQPGGSIADQEVIDAANNAGIGMVFTGIRHFKH